jgi:hypothetical protein
MGACGRTHSDGTCSPAQIICAARMGVRHWKLEYTALMAVMSVSFHLRMKLISSSPMKTG